MTPFRQAHPQEPEPSALYRAAEFAVFVAGIAVVLYVLLVWLP